MPFVSPNPPYSGSRASRRDSGRGTGSRQLTERVTFQDAASQPITVDFSLKGFTAALTVGEQGKINGSTVAETVRIFGTVSGRVQAKTVRLDSSARVTADITHENLTIEAGAYFEGKVLPLKGASSGGAAKL